MFKITRFLNKIIYFLDEKLYLRYTWIIFALIFYLMYSKSKNDKILNDSKLCFYAKVVDEIITTKQSIFNYEYEFYYKGLKYKGVDYGYEYDNIQVGSYYRIEFSSSNPNINEIYFEKSIEKDRIDKKPISCSGY